MSNIHYDCKEEDLRQLFRENNFKVVKLIMHKDHETGRPKGSGICEFESANDAALAI